MKMNCIIFAFLGFAFSSALAADDAVKNHRLEKRQDDSYLFFGGWQPLKSSGDTYRTSASGRYHDLISALPGSADAVAGYYTHALPSASNYYKDIYNYYPRPAIKNAPKKNTPVYMERLKPQRQQPKRGGKGSKSSGGAPQFFDIQKLELNHLRELQNVLLQAKELPLSKLNLPNLQSYGGKQFEIVEVAVQPVQQSSYNTGSRNTNRYNRNRGAQRNNKGSYRRVPQNIKPNQLPLQFQYISVPKIKSSPPQILPKQIPLTSIKLPQGIPAIDDIINLKNIQVVEVPAPSAVPVSISSGKISVGSQYGKRNNGYSQQQQYRIPTPKSPQKVSFPANAYYSHNSEQPRKYYAAPSSSKSNYGAQQQAQIEAELVKLSEEEVQELFKNLQIVQQNSQDFLKIIPLAEATHKMKSDQVQLVLTLPPGIQEQNIETSSYGSQNGGKETSYSSKEPYVAIPQDTAYPSQDAASISYNSGGYQLSTHSQGAEHSASGYQIDEQGRSPYEQYQTLDGKAGYIRKPYEEVRSTKTRESAYDQDGYDAPANQQGGHSHSQQYLEIMTPPADASGYKREPVLAVEIQKGQSIEDAIKAIDPETLKRLGAHGKDGLEIELVEVPVEEYSSESKKAETYVSSTNSTTPAAKTTTAAPVQKAKTTTTEKKS